MAYKRLAPVEREEIMLMLLEKRTLTEIASRLHRNVSTISREIAHNRSSTGVYSAFSAQKRAQHQATKHHTVRKLSHGRLWREIVKKLKLRWSPRQIAQYLRSQYPHDPSMHVSHETIYSHIYVQGRGQLRKTLTGYLRQQRAKRRTRTGPPDRRGKIPDMISIHQRPAEVADRTVPGHWEGDLLKGSGNKTALGTLVERTSRFTILVPLTAWDAASVRKAYARAMRHLPAHMRRSMTYDQGREMTEHARFTMDTKIQVYFADPHSPWMRGTNENTNGLIRDFFPKTIDFTTVSRYRIKRVQHMLNERPRETLQWRTPKDVFSELVRTTK